MNPFEQIILISLGTAFSFIGISGLFKYYTATRSWIKVKGIITSFQQSNTTPVTYTPILKYTTIDGEEIEKESDFGESQQVYRRGEELNILYNPNKKDHFIIKGAEAILLPSIFLLVGLGLLTAYYFIPLPPPPSHQP